MHGRIRFCCYCPIALGMITVGAALRLDGMQGGRFFSG